MAFSVGVLPHVMSLPVILAAVSYFEFFFRLDGKRNAVHTLRRARRLSSKTPAACRRSCPQFFDGSFSFICVRLSVEVSEFLLFLLAVLSSVFSFASAELIVGRAVSGLPRFFVVDISCEFDLLSAPCSWRAKVLFYFENFFFTPRSGLPQCPLCARMTIFAHCDGPSFFPACPWFSALFRGRCSCVRLLSRVAAMGPFFFSRSFTMRAGGVGWNLRVSG